MEREIGEVTNKSKPIINISRPFKVASFLVFHISMIIIMTFNLVVFSLRIKGRKNANIKRAFLVSNHLLYLDGPVVAHTLWPQRCYYSALEKTFQVPVLGTYLRLMGVFPIPENNPIKKVLKPIELSLHLCGYVHFFPEGELYRLNQRLKEFQDGVFFFSILKKVPVIPITIVVKKRRLWGKELSFLPCRVISIVGKPVYPEKFLGPGAPRRDAMVAMSRYLRHVMQETIEGEHTNCA
jgi:1-acyl-sn-glycerol-3-phosphate acyltransferase